MTKQYRVAWKYKDGSLSGHGDPTTLYHARIWIQKAQPYYPDIEHWVEEVPIDEKPK